MAKIIPIAEHHQHFLAEMRKSFRGNVYGEMGYRVFAGEIAAAAASPSMGNH
jgi:hypothetical protein